MKTNHKIRGLKPDLKTENAARMVLSSRLEVLRKLLAKPSPELSVEFVHQLRVGTRRVGAALRVFRDLIPNRKLNALRDQLRNIRQAAADTRDWDVFLKYLSESSDTNAYLIGFAQGVRSRVEVWLAVVLQEQTPALLTSMTKLPQSVGRSGSVPRTLGKFAEDQLPRYFEKFAEALSAKPKAAAELHRLRILGKRLRYSLELFNGCLPAEQIEPYLEALTEVQGILGSVQDVAVFQAHVAGIQSRAPESATTFKNMLRNLAKMDRSNRTLFRAWLKKWNKLIAVKQ